MTEVDWAKNADRIKEIGERAGDVWPGMSWRAFARLCGYVSDCQREMNLEHWAVTIAHFPLADETVGASIQAIWGRRNATLKVAADWNQWDERKKRNTIGHELVHLILEDFWHAATKDIEPFLGREAYKLYELMIEKHYEYAVDHLAELLTLPEYPNSDEKVEEV